MENKGAVKGQVKWFDATKGFGFIVAEGYKTDILLHANVLRSFGRNSVAGNSQIEVVVQVTERGCQAIEIKNIEPPINGGRPEIIAQILGDGVTIDPGSPLLPARVKWFDREKGFGFVNAFAKAEDIFIHMEVLHACGLAELMSGEAVSIRVAHGPRGMMVWDVQVWDNAVPKEGKIDA